MLLKLVLLHVHFLHKSLIFFAGILDVPSRPSGKLPFDCKKIAKNLTFFPKKMPKIFIFFKKIAIGNFFEKNEIFLAIFLKKCQIFGNFLTVKWQFSGGSAWNIIWSLLTGRSSTAILCHKF